VLAAWACVPRFADTTLEPPTVAMRSGTTLSTPPAGDPTAPPTPTESSGWFGADGRSPIFSCTSPREASGRSALTFTRPAAADVPAGGTAAGGATTVSRPAPTSCAALVTVTTGASSDVSPEGAGG